MIDEELKKISNLTLEALEEIDRRNYPGAKRLLRAIEDSPCISEADQARLLIRSLILVRKKKFGLARQKLISESYSTWGSEDLLRLLRLCHRPVTEKTKRFTLTLEGGMASFGAFTQFGQELFCVVEILADSLEDAKRYAFQLCHFAEPDSVVVRSAIEDPWNDAEEHEGVLRTSPFRSNRIFESNSVT